MKALFAALPLLLWCDVREAALGAGDDVPARVTLSEHVASAVPPTWRGAKGGARAVRCVALLLQG